VLRHRFLTLLVFLATIALTVGPPTSDAEGLSSAGRHRPDLPAAPRRPDISFESMKDLQQRATKVVLSDPAVAYIERRSAPRRQRLGQQRPAVHQSETAIRRGNVTSQQVINRLRRSSSTSAACGFHVPGRRISVPAGVSPSSSYQFTLWDPDLDELLRARARACRQGTDPA